MDVIQLLPAAVIDQIAAGEVIERPASVVKELVENAVDACAKIIAVEIQAGGRHLVRVVDDGRGMSPGDAVKALERHATSKLRAFEDLWRLTTMGFRGEALSAIASVSRFTLTTRRAEDLAATRVIVEGGRLFEVGETGGPVGTTVEVADLFWNVPARLKFMKSEATEATHISELVARVAMAYPELHLRLRHNGRVGLETPPDRDGFSRAQALLGSQISTRMIEVSGEEAGVRVRCFLGAPELAQTSARGVQLFVGRRSVRDRGLLHAIAMGYGELVPRGRHPVAVVLIDVPNGAVDINVHPQKSEVRFSDPNAVHAALRHVIQSGVARTPWRDEVSGRGGHVVMNAVANVAPARLPFDRAATPLAQTYSDQLKESRRRKWSRESAQVSHGLEGRNSDPQEWVSKVKERLRVGEVEQVAPRLVTRDLQSTIPEVAAAVSAALRRIAAAEAQGGASPSARPRASTHGAGVHEESQLAVESVTPATSGFFASLRYLGQLDLRYLVCEADGELVLIDQHIAHERVELARLKGQSAIASPLTQGMLFPTTFEVRHEVVELATRLAPLLARAGFDVEAFGHTTLALKRVPRGIRHGDPAVVLRELLENWPNDDPQTDAERFERVLIEIACHSVVRVGDRLSPSEVEGMLRSLDRANLSRLHPHAGEVLLRLPVEDLARRFGR